MRLRSTVLGVLGNDSKPELIAELFRSFSTNEFAAFTNFNHGFFKNSLARPSTIAPCHRTSACLRLNIHEQGTNLLCLAENADTATKHHPNTG